MKKIFLLFFVCVTFNIYSQQLVTGPIVIKPVLKPVFKPVRVGYRHLRIKSRPQTKKDLILKISFISDSVNPQFNNAQKKQIQKIILLLREKKVIIASREWKRFIIQLRNKAIPLDINNIIQQILKKAYMNSTSDLQFHASRVRAMSDQKELIREHLINARKQFKRCRTVNVCASNTTRGLQDVIASWEEKLQTIGDDAQLASIDLQNMLQKQQQTIQMISNVSKILHDTALAVIRKIG